MLNKLASAKSNLLIAKVLAREILSIFNVRGDEPERFYHALVLGMLAILARRTHEVRSNRESGAGRYDVMIDPKDSSQPGVIIEFKKARRRPDETFETAAQNALKQIADRNTGYTEYAQARYSF